MNNVVVRKSRNGKGVFAARDFRARAVAYEVRGAFITGDADEDIEDSVRDNAFRYSEDLYISPEGEIGQYQNHSCEPNARVAKRGKRLFVVALSAIPCGHEVLIDYSTITGADDIWEMKCNCGSSACRRIIGSFDSLPKPLQASYRKNRIVPAFVAKLRA